ncbi:MAG: aminotransferase class III-fold pyridoxal phosphate-dependent enzyme [Victivallaceae bacterium]|nr:aminotransferase class III-fold pyridoxal phosphate-dependent enzyme [Victivallaceae bacterium]
MQKTIKSWEKYRRSTEFLAQGSSTLSKIPRFENIEPAQIVKGKGCRVWDIDGNEYIDYRNGLGPITLGYCIPEINEAIKEQLENGIIFGHPHVLEGEAAEMLTEVIPCAERVRFLKTGGEAIAACIKIARAFTGRNRIIRCGYNGWLNSLSSGGFQPAAIGSANSLKGVPAVMQSLYASLPWAENEKWEEALEKYGNETAAVVIASDYASMDKAKSFLPFIRKLTEKHGVLMIMDEIVTGFRVAMGGIHEYCGFMPDMAVFAKGISNGMPVSAYVGKGEFIDSVRELGISSTYAGETLSLAALKAVINFYRKNKVINTLWERGKQFKDGINSIFWERNFPAALEGFPVCPIFNFREPGKSDAFFKECYRNGISLYNVSYVNWSHTEKDIAITADRIRKVLETI